MTSARKSSGGMPIHSHSTLIGSVCSGSSIQLERKTARQTGLPAIDRRAWRLHASAIEGMRTNHS